MQMPSAGPDGAIAPWLAAVIVENATEYAILTLDRGGRITSWSPGAEHILGYAAQEALGQDFGILFLDADRAANAPAAELKRALEEGRAEDTRWHRRKDGQIFWANGMTMRVRAGDALVKVMRDETAAKLAEDQRVLLLNELNHRIKNTLATVQAIVEQTLRGSQAAAAVRESLIDRLVALSEAHNVLVDESWAGADLMAIVRRALGPHDVDNARFTLEGPAVRLSPQQAVSMSLVLHELATNALKYGALSVAGGRVSITWNIAHSSHGVRHLTLLWRESGGPAVTQPSRQGFGTRLIERSFASGGGRAELVFDPEGLRWILETPLSAAEEIPMLPISRDPSNGGSRKGRRRPSAGSPASGRPDRRDRPKP